MLYAFLLLIVLLLALGSVRARLARTRRIPGYGAIELGAAESIETGRGAVVAIDAPIGGSETATALAAAVPLRYITERTAIGDRPTLATTANPINLTLAALVMKRAAEARGTPDLYRRRISVSYLPNGLPYAAATGLYAADQRAYLSTLLGSSGIEMALMNEPVARNGGLPVPIGLRAESAAVSYAYSATPLLGEELYAGSGIIGPERSRTGILFALDVLRAAVLVIVLLSAFGILS